MDDFRMQIESEFRRRNRSGNDFIIEKGKIYKMIDDIDKKCKKSETGKDIVAESIGCLLES